MKVIFLDIDGVMNSELFYTNRYQKRWLRPITYYYLIRSKIKYVFNGFKNKGVSLIDYKISKKHKEFKYLFERLKKETEALKWKWLSEFCEKENCKICISSVWRNHFNNYDEWNKALMLLGFNDKVFVGTTGKRRTERGEEIKEWLDNNVVEKYAIIDDDNDMLPEQLSNFFVTDGYCGLSPSVLYRIGRHFNKK